MVTTVISWDMGPLGDYGCIYIYMYMYIYVYIYMYYIEAQNLCVGTWEASSRMPEV